MPIRRFRTALALAVAAAGVVVSGASAGAALPDREITSKVVETKRNQLFFKGRVTPDYAEKPVVIQKRDCLKKSCDWHRHATVGTDETGRFRSKITAPRKGYDYWRAKVNPEGEYGRSFSGVWRTWTS